MAKKVAAKTPQPRAARGAGAPASERRGAGRGAPATNEDKVAKLARPGKYVYYFGDGKADGDRTMKDLLGGKGSGLAEMTNAKLPVPAGFTISTPVP